MPYRRPGGGGGAPAQAFAADTSGAPVTITLPALDGLEDGYLVRVYDAGSNASVNNITINDADAAAVDVIDEDDGERWLVVVGGAWEVRGYLPVGEAQTYLHQLAIDAGAKHVWLGPDNPLEDLVGAADLTLITTGEAAAHIPQGTRSALVRANGGVSSGAGPSAAGVTIHKGAERSGIYMFTLGAAPSGHMGVMALGTYTDANSGPAITANSAVSRVRFFDHNWGVGSGLDLFNYAGNLGIPCVVFWWWDLANLVYRVAWRLEGSAEQTGTLAAASEGSGSVTVYAGAQGSAMNTITSPFTRHAFALADGDVLYDAAFRNSVYAALGWA